jgi:hypothetical protein
LEKCGFSVVGRGSIFFEVHGQSVDELLMALR